MAEKRVLDKRTNWIWKYCIKENNIIMCDICPLPSYVCHNYCQMKQHLFRVHGKSDEKDIDRTSLIWPYFTEQERYTFICKICNDLVSSNGKYTLVLHLVRWHPEKIAEVQEEFKRLWISHHFISHTENQERKIYCKNCNKMFDIFIKIKFLTKHLLNHNINGSSHTEGINMNITTQSVPEENNVDATFHETTHLQAEEN